jgi:hypothetical protein
MLLKSADSLLCPTEGFSLGLKICKGEGMISPDSEAKPVGRGQMSQLLEEELGVGQGAFRP